MKSLFGVCCNALLLFGFIFMISSEAFAALGVASLSVPSSDNDGRYSVSWGRYQVPRVTNFRGS